MSLDIHMAVESEVLLKDAKRVFGSYLVEKAWFVETGSDRHTESQLRSTEISYKPSDECEITLPTCSAVMFRFVNGAQVIFSSSEWGSVDRSDKPIIYVHPNPPQPETP